jgi:hypothetical protein
MRLGCDRLHKSSVPLWSMEFLLVLCAVGACRMATKSMQRVTNTRLADELFFAVQARSAVVGEIAIGVEGDGRQRLRPNGQGRPPD